MTDTLSPMDSIQYFDPPKVTSFSVSNTGASHIVSYNPMRVGLILSCAAAGGAVCLPDPSVTSSKGIQISGSVLPIMLTQTDWGILVQSDWYAIGVGATVTVTVTEVLLNKWPTPVDAINGALQLAAK